MLYHSNIENVGWPGEEASTVYTYTHRVPMIRLDCCIKILYYVLSKLNVSHENIFDVCSYTMPCILVADVRVCKFLEIISTIYYGCTGGTLGLRTRES